MPKRLKIPTSIYFIFLFSFLCYLLFFTDVKDFLSISIADHDYSTGWQFERGEYVDVTKIGAGRFNGNLRISKTLPDSMQETDAIYFSTSNLRFKLYVDGDLIYAFDTEENMTGVGDGISYHMIGLGKKDEGRTVIIEGDTVFSDGHSGRINEMYYGPEETYRYYIIRNNMPALLLSLLMIIFGVVLIVFYFGMSAKNPMIRPIWALGVAAILFGNWSLCDTGVLQLLTGVTYASRSVVYGILHLTGFPMVYFVNSITGSRKRFCVYLSFLCSVGSFSWLLISRYVFNRDLHTMVAFIYFSYAMILLMILYILIDNEIYCRKEKKRSGLGYFYMGAGLFIVASFADMVRYMIDRRGSIGHGSLFRFGMVLFILFMAFQIFDWWSSEKSSLERDRFINRLLQYAMGTDDPEIRIGKLLEYLCLELHADRAYIFEDMQDGTFDNTYEFCAEGVTPEIDHLKGLPYEGVIDVWYKEYEKGGHILIYDLEKYREVSENMYNVLKPQGIHTLVTGPLILEGEYIGFFGVDNPPAEAMKEVSEIIRLLMFFLSEMLSQRDDKERLVKYSYHDPLTGAKNRRAISRFEKEELDTSRSYGFIMCDINGLKAVNDTEGHDAGDEMIRTVALCLVEVFGSENVYRMGGDEFAVYEYADSLQQMEAEVAKVKEGLGKKGVYVAIGYAYAEGGDPDHAALRTLADNRMYEDKKEFYRHNERRRPRAD